MQIKFLQNFTKYETTERDAALDSLHNGVGTNKDSAVRYIWERLVTSARKREIELTLTKAQVFGLSKMPCTYCGTAPKALPETSKRQEIARNGIDRIDSERGYTPDNVVPCCKRCNWAKHDSPLTEFLEWLQQVRGFNPTETLQERIAKVQYELARTDKLEALLDSQPQASRGKPVLDSLGNRFGTTQAAADHHGFLRTDVVAFLRGWRIHPANVSFRYEDPAANDNANRPVAKNQPGQRREIIDDLGNRYNSISEAASACGASHNSVRNNLRGLQKQAKGRVFKYVKGLP